MILTIYYSKLKVNKQWIQIGCVEVTCIYNENIIDIIYDMDLLTVAIGAMLLVCQCQCQKDPPYFHALPENVTVLEHDNVTLSCTPEGFPKPTVTWTHNGITLPAKQGSRFKRLKIRRVKLEDEGWYACVARNIHGEGQTPPVYLEVQVAAKIEDGPINREVPWGAELTINCRVRGKPKPNISWTKNNKPVIDEDTLNVYSKNSLTMNVTENATYGCSAENVLFHDVAIHTQKGNVTYQENTRPIGDCANLDFGNSVCAAYLSPYTPVFLNYSYTNPQQAVEDILILAFKYTAQSFQTSCQAPVQRLLCQSLYPECSKQQGSKVVPKPICRSSCQEIAEGSCADDWKSLQSHKHNINSFTGAVPGLVGCDSLPQQECTSIFKQAANQVTVLIPEPEQVLDGDFSIPATLFSQTFIIIMIICSAVCVVLVGVIICFSCRLWTKEHHNDYLRPIQHEMANRINLKIGKLKNNTFYHQRLSSSSSASSNRSSHRLQQIEFPRNEIVYLESIGRGAYGKLFKAKAKFMSRGYFNENVIVVKTLWQDKTGYMEDDLIREAELMCELDHPNIIKLLGVCLNDQPLCLLYEYMSEGDLTEFLRKQSPQYFSVQDDLNKDVNTPKGHLRILNTVELLDMAIQIASAMLYITGKGYLHCDLATRNCLVGDHLNVKISDFAMMRGAREAKDYVRGAEHDPVPVRWMSPEAIFCNKYSVESEVWSFGVVLWEIFSFGMQPYYEHQSLEEVMAYLKEGHILDSPVHTPADVYDVMKQCWSAGENKRPKFPALYISLTQLRQKYRYTDTCNGNTPPHASALTASCQA